MKKSSSTNGAATYFKPGNRAGLATRFKPGQSGNPLGRPPKTSTCLAWMRHPNIKPGHLHQIMEREDFRKTEKAAARQLLVAYYRRNPFLHADPIETRRVYRQWYKARRVYLQQALIDQSESPERREAARQRLKQQ